MLSAAKQDAIPEPTENEQPANASRLKWSFCLVAICLGAVLAWAGDSYQGDAVSYLDMGDRFFAGDRTAIVNGLWSPLFPFVQGLARWVVKPSMRWEPTVFQVTNWLIFVTTVISFQFFWGTVLQLYKRLTVAQEQERCAILSDRAFWVLGYTIFLFMHLDLVTAGTPDMLLSTCVYLAASFTLQFRLRRPALRTSCLMGLALGLGYLTKAIMLPLAGLFLVAATFGRVQWRRTALYTTVSLLIFAAVASPYVFALSKKLGHFTTGESGSLNYAFHVNAIPFTNWQGGPSRLGAPLHPTREVFSSPPVYEFATPSSGTYPPWDDPFYWNEGYQVSFNWADQLSTLKPNLLAYFRLLQTQAALIAGILILLAMRGSARTVVRNYFEVWYIWAPALLAFAAYAAVWVEGRYLAQFFVLFWAAAVTLVRLPDRNESRRLLRCVCVVVVILMNIRTITLLPKNAVSRHHHSEEQVHIAESIAEAGIHRGEKLAVVGSSLADGWQKLSGVSVVAEISADDADQFWVSGESQRARVFEAFAKTGATVAIAEEIPRWALTPGWERVGATSVYIHPLNR